MKALSFLRSITFGALKPWKSTPAKIVPNLRQTQDQLSGDLGFILPVTCRRAGSQAVFQLLASNLTPTRLIFRTDTPLKEHECLEVEILLQGIGNMCITAQVQFVVQATKTRVNTPLSSTEPATIPMYSGQLELWSTDRQSHDIRNFLRRHTTRQRSTLGSGPISV